MKNTIRVVIKSIVYSLIPALCTYISSTDMLVWAQNKQYIGDNVNIELIKNIFLLLSILLTSGLLTLNLTKHELKETRYKRQSIELIKYTKEIMVSALSNKLGKEYCNINIRIFVPEKNIVKMLWNKITGNKNLFFCIKNIDGLAEAGMTNNLRFRVLPNDKKQGLVGKCYNERKMIYDDNLSVTNNKNWNLSDFQKSKTNDLEFIIVCPTFNQNGEIDSIVAFDSSNRIKVEKKKEEELSNLILNYTQQLHEKVPEIFKPKGGIL